MLAPQDITPTSLPVNRATAAAQFVPILQTTALNASSGYISMGKAVFQFVQSDIMPPLRSSFASPVLLTASTASKQLVMLARVDSTFSLGNAMPSAPSLFTQVLAQGHAKIALQTAPLAPRIKTALYVQLDTCFTTAPAARIVQ